MSNRLAGWPAGSANIGSCYALLQSTRELEEAGGFHSTLSYLWPQPGNLGAMSILPSTPLPSFPLHDLHPQQPRWCSLHMVI